METQLQATHKGGEIYTQVSCLALLLLSYRLHPAVNSSLVGTEFLNYFRISFLHGHLKSKLETTQILMQNSIERTTLHAHILILNQIPNPLRQIPVRKPMLDPLDYLNHKSHPLREFKTHRFNQHQCHLFKVKGRHHLPNSDT